jgi:DNA-binding transcriptional ArsR family regulator
LLEGNFQMPTRIETVCGEAGHEAGRAMAPVADPAIERASRIFRALGDPARLRLLEFLTRGEACVTEVAEAAGDEISTVSQRLRVLRGEGLVSRRRQGKHIVYGLADQHVVDLIFNALEHATERRKA